MSKSDPQTVEPLARKRPGFFMALTIAYFAGGLLCFVGTFVLGLLNVGGSSAYLLAVCGVVCIGWAMWATMYAGNLTETPLFMRQLPSFLRKRA